MRVNLRSLGQKEWKCEGWLKLGIWTNFGKKHMGRENDPDVAFNGCNEKWHRIM
jgi:hypothetical protein